MAIYEYDQYGNASPNYLSPASNIQGQYQGLNSRGELIGTVNPVAMAQEASSRLYGERITPKFQLQYDILPDNLLISTFDLQFDINNSKTKRFLPQVATGRPSTETSVNRADDNDGDAFAVNTKLNFIFSPKLGEKHTLQTLLSFQTEDNQANSQKITVSNTASSLLQDPSNPARVSAGGLTLDAGIGQQRTIGVVVANQYSLLDRYIINVGARLDGNSRFGANNRYGIFPSLSTRWRISGEPFMRGISWIDDLSLRGSYGASGQQPRNNYMFYNTYVPSNDTYLGKSGVIPGNIGLDDLRWQTNVGRNLGVNFWTFKNRLKLDVEVYNNQIKDLFFDNLTIPSYTGYNRISANVGVMVNKGFEVGLNTIPYRSKNWLVAFDFNVAQNINVIKEISPFYARTDGALINNGVYRSYLQEGNPFGSFYGFRYKGVYTDKDATRARDANGDIIEGPNGQEVFMRYNYPNVDYVFQAGDAIYDDVNKDGNINEDDLVYLGNGNPTVTGGFGPTVTYKGMLKLQAFFSYKSGFELINRTLMTTTNMYAFENQSTVVLDRWRNPGDVTDVPRALYRDGYNWLGSDRYVSDGSFLRLKSVTARYDFNKAVLNKLKLSRASLYVTAENLATWTKYKGVDPDVSTRGLNTPFSYLSDGSMTPPSKNFVLGLSVNF